MAVKGRQLNRKQSSRFRKSEESDYDYNQAAELDKILFIMPKNPPSTEPTMDEVTRLVTRYWAFNKRSKYTREIAHRCSCGVSGSNTDHFIGSNYDILTNALCLHYVQFHRDEITPAELDRVVSLLTPTKD